MNEDKATRYHRLRRRGIALALGVRVGLCGGVLALGVSPAVRTVVERLIMPLGLPWPLQTALGVGLFALALGVVTETLAFPFVWHTWYFLDRRYGLSQESFIDWLHGYAKTLFLGLAFWVTSAAVVYLAIAGWPEAWWVVAWATFVAVTVAVTKLGPVVVLPWLYTIKPLRRKELKRRLEVLARRAGAPLVGVDEWHLGDRALKVNAALIGLGSTRRVLLSDTLLTDYSDDEVEAVLAHELAHHVNRDIWKTMAYEMGVVLCAFWVAARILVLLAPTLGLHGVSDIAGLPLLALSVGGVVLLSSPVSKLLSRHHERRADQYAVELTGNRDALVSGLRRIGSQNLAEERPSWLVECLFYTHPPLSKRVAAARGLVGAPVDYR